MAKAKKKPKPRYTKKTNNPKMGRPKKPINWVTAQRLCESHCTHAEIAYKLDIAPNNLNDRCIVEQGMTFSEFYNKNKHAGKANIRAVQYSKALKGDNTMLVWLGKNNLGQSDKTEIDIHVKPYVIESPDGKEVIKLGVQDTAEIEAADIIDVETIDQSEGKYYDGDSEDEDVEDDSVE